MTLPRLRDLTDYWVDNPPTSIAMSAILKGLSGNKGKSKKRPRVDGEFVPQDMPKDEKGFPTKYAPGSLDVAVMELGGKVRRFKTYRGDKG